jgi:exopolyphosphatase/guanosine-5'-triphosphate,3'-diphosphate pyrophosphatase
MAANIARYHRKGEPASSHEAYMALSEKDRLRVSRLAAIVRIADGLDREHRQSVHAVRVRAADGHVTLDLQGSGDLLLERWAVQRKSALFEKLFGLKLRIREEARV